MLSPYRFVVLIKLFQYAVFTALAGIMPAHTIEMGGDPNREEPFFFQKNAQNADTTGTFPYPPESQDVHHEVEMVVALKGGGKNISVDDALSYVYGYGVGIDMTRRDLQGCSQRPASPVGAR
jgi:fumarylpyruvate hydrolase